MENEFTVASADLTGSLPNEATSPESALPSTEASSSVEDWEYYPAENEYMDTTEETIAYVTEPVWLTFPFWACIMMIAGLRFLSPRNPVWPYRVFSCPP